MALRLAFAHHPLCHHFGSDRIGPFCSGCMMFWPAFLMATPIVVSLILGGTDSWALLLAGATLGLPQLVGVRRRMGRSMRAAIKLLGGVAVATATTATVMLPVPAWVKVALFGSMLAAFAAILALRMRSILATCQACPWKRDWEACPGFVPGAPARPPAALPGPRP